QRFFHSEVMSWVGVFLCYGGLILFLLSLVSFGKSFRVGIDIDHPDKLVTTGVFAFSRNPIYVAFAFVFLWQFLVFPHWIFFVYLPRCRHLAVPPASIARRRILEEAIRPGIRGVLQSSEKVSLSAPSVACQAPGCSLQGLFTKIGPGRSLPGYHIGRRRCMLR